jgi:hypothetical protein
MMPHGGTRGAETPKAHFGDVVFRDRRHRRRGVPFFVETGFQIGIEASDVQKFVANG